MRPRLVLTLTLATAVLAVLVAWLIPVIDPPAHQTDLRPGLVLLAGALVIALVGVLALTRWVLRSSRARAAEDE